MPITMHLPPAARAIVQQSEARATRYERKASSLAQSMAETAKSAGVGGSLLAGVAIAAAVDARVADPTVGKVPIVPVLGLMAGIAGIAIDHEAGDYLAAAGLGTVLPTWYRFLFEKMAASGTSMVMDADKGTMKMMLVNGQSTMVSTTRGDASAGGLHGTSVEDLERELARAGVR